MQLYEKVGGGGIRLLNVSTKLVVRLAGGPIISC